MPALYNVYVVEKEWRDVGEWSVMISLWKIIKKALKPAKGIFYSFLFFFYLLWLAILAYFSVLQSGFWRKKNKKGIMFDRITSLVRHQLCRKESFYSQAWVFDRSPKASFRLWLDVGVDIFCYSLRSIHLSIYALE